MRRALVTAIIGLTRNGTGFHRSEPCTYTFSGSYDPASSVVKLTLRGTDTRPSAAPFH